MKLRIISVTLATLALCGSAIRSQETGVSQRLAIPPSAKGERVTSHKSGSTPTGTMVVVETANTYGPVNLAVTIPATSHFTYWEFWMKEGAVSEGEYNQCTNPDHSCPGGWALWADPVQFPQDGGKNMTIQTTFWNSSNGPRRGRFKVWYQ